LAVSPARTTDGHAARDAQTLLLAAREAGTTLAQLVRDLVPQRPLAQHPLGALIHVGPAQVLEQLPAKGVVVARDVADLHGANGLTKQTALNEKAEVINGRGDQPNRHDILTGSQPDGTAFAVGEDRTCKNWTSSVQGSAVMGHSDRLGLRDDEPSKSWNSSHGSRGPDGGCSQADLRSTGGDGLLYCFAAN